MDKLKFEIEIEESPEEVWKAITTKHLYTYWCSVFEEGTYFEGTWEKGQKMKFLSNRTSTPSGLISIVEESDFPKHISLKHLGTITDDVEDTTSEEVEKWAPLYEKYFFEKIDSGTKFVVEMDPFEGYKEMFEELWPKALEKLKHLCEKMVFIQATINSPIEKVWKYYTDPKHIVEWNFASDDWFCPQAKSDFEENGKFSYTMSAKDDSFSFDFEGTFDKIIENKLIEYSIIDGRKVFVYFEPENDSVKASVLFEIESMNPKDMQRQGWQSILDNFKKVCESN